MDDDRISRPIFWIVVVSSAATVFYTILFSLVHERIPMTRPWQMGILASILLNWGSVYCDKEGGRFNQFASYAAGLSMLVANVVFSCSAFALLLGPRSSLYHFMYERTIP